MASAMVKRAEFPVQKTGHYSTLPCETPNVWRAHHCNQIRGPDEVGLINGRADQGTTSCGEIVFNSASGLTKKLARH
jgi:hypothetical protein